MNANLYLQGVVYTLQALKRDERLAWVVGAARYQGALGHPLFFDHRLFPELAALHGDKAAWRLLDRHPQSIASVDLDWPAPANINTVEDYDALIRGG